MMCDCTLYDPDPNAVEDETCHCGHVLDEHEPAPGGHPGACTVELGDPDRWAADY